MALRDWFSDSRSRREPPSPMLASALADLERLIVERPELGSAGRSLARVLTVAFREPVPEPHLHADPDLILAGWRAGVPAFQSGEIPPDLDRDDLHSRGSAICESLAPDNPKAETLVAAIRTRKLELHALALAALGDRPEMLDERAAAIGIEPALLQSVLRLSLLPTLARLTERLATIRPEGVWERGDCPNCGSFPVLAESRGLEQSRRWRCGLCAGDWLGHRLRCPFCSETDHRNLHYRYVEGEPDRYRLGLCDSCGKGLTVVATLGPLSAPSLLVAEFATVHLVK